MRYLPQCPHRQK
jgi:arginine decarboxylase